MTDSLDTNIVLRCILGDNLEQRKKVAKLLGQSGTLHYFSNQALMECMYVLEKIEGMSREEIVNQMGLFLARYTDTIAYDDALTRIAFPFYLSHPKLSWGDCALAAEAEIKHHEPLWTFDKKLANQAPQAKMLA